MSYQLALFKIEKLNILKTPDITTKNFKGYN